MNAAAHQHRRDAKESGPWRRARPRRTGTPGERPTARRAGRRLRPRRVVPRVLRRQPSIESGATENPASVIPSGAKSAPAGSRANGCPGTRATSTPGCPSRRCRATGRRAGDQRQLAQPPHPLVRLRHRGGLGHTAPQPSSASMKGTDPGGPNIPCPKPIPSLERQQVLSVIGCWLGMCRRAGRRAGAGTRRGREPWAGTCRPGRRAERLSSTRTRAATATTGFYIEAMRKIVPDSALLAIPPAPRRPARGARRSCQSCRAGTDPGE